jgi:hypothetical protein
LVECGVDLPAWRKTKGISNQYRRCAVIGEWMHHRLHYGEKFMLDVIDFMERMGGDAQLSQASSGELATALADSEVTPEQRAALLARDAQRLGELLGTKPLCVLVAPPGPGPGPAHPVAPARMPPAPRPEEAEDAEEDQGE